MTSTIYLRSIKSFALREGRLTPRQQLALQTDWARYALPKDTQIEWQSVFPAHAPIILDIGFGMGHSLLKSALTWPERCFIGIEVYRPGIGTLLAELKKQQIDNVRVFHGDAVEILTTCIPNDSLDAVHIFFPDPWPKRRHHKRRLVQTAFIQLIAQKLKLHGKLHLATDWEDYAIHMSRVLLPLVELTSTVSGTIFAPDNEDRPLTKYEQRGQRLGHPVWDLIFKKTTG